MRKMKNRVFWCRIQISVLGGLLSWHPRPTKQRPCHCPKQNTRSTTRTNTQPSSSRIGPTRVDPISNLRPLPQLECWLVPSAPQVSGTLQHPVMASLGSAHRFSTQLCTSLWLRLAAWLLDLGGSIYNYFLSFRPFWWPY